MKIAASRRTVERLFAVVTLASSIEQVDDIRSLHTLIVDQSRTELEELALVLAVILSRTSSPELIQKNALEIAEDPAVNVVIL